MWWLFSSPCECAVPHGVLGTHLCPTQHVTRVPGRWVCHFAAVEPRRAGVRTPGAGPWQLGTHSGWWSLWTLCAAQPCLRDIGTHTHTLGLFPDLKSVDLVNLLGGPGEPKSQ